MEALDPRSDATFASSSCDASCNELCSSTEEEEEEEDGALPLTMMALSSSVDESRVAVFALLLLLLFASDDVGTVPLVSSLRESSSAYIFES